MKQYLTQLVNNSIIRTPQSQKIPGSSQTENSAGGFIWSVDLWQRLHRFLILGSEGGSYYATEIELSLDNAQNVLNCIQTDGIKTVDMIVDVSVNGRAPKNDPAIFALALASSAGDDVTRRAALNVVPTVCRTTTHLFGFLEIIKGMRGWGRGLRNAVGVWYTAKDASTLAYQMVKYRQRVGWTHADVLRKAHPTPVNSTQDQLFKWVTNRDEVNWRNSPYALDDEALAFVWAFERVQEAKTVNDVVQLIEQYDLPREALPTQWLKTPQVWEALLSRMPMTAMIRNLGNMSKCELLVPNSNAEQLVVERLMDVERLLKARIHPIAVLSALMVYQLGHPLAGGYARRRSNLDGWTPSMRVVDALDSAFALAFDAVQPSGKRTMLALDVSGSMAMGMIAGVPGLTPRIGSAAMAMITARTEQQAMFTAFTHELVPIDISAKMRLDNVVKTMSGLPFGRTDCAQPMLYAMKRKLKVDNFVIYTDSETWYGDIHPVQALNKYRDAMGIPATLVVVGMISNSHTIADPDDRGMLDVVGFDTAAPNIINAFARGEI